MDDIYYIFSIMYYKNCFISKIKHADFFSFYALSP